MRRLVLIGSFLTAFLLSFLLPTGLAGAMCMHRTCNFGQCTSDWGDEGKSQCICEGQGNRWIPQQGERRQIVRCPTGKARRTTS